jgi:hypothetical protein
MKQTLSIFLILALTFLFSCKEEKPKAQPIKSTVSTSKVKHYICDNNCENSGSDVAGNCPVCKNQYTHNTAYHANDLLKSGPLNVPSNATQSTKNNQNKKPSPAQNTAGVYHYTCINGCNGGSATATKCVSCGEVLVHNQIYHNK